MPRKKENKPEAYYDTFPTTLRKIMEKQGKTQQDVAEAIGKTRQAVGYYCDGSSSPDWKTLVGLAQYFGVSTDHLLGLAENPSSNPKVTEICKYTGLSQKAVEVLNSYGKCSLISVISELIEQEEWDEEIDDAIGVRILSTINAFLAIDRSSSRVYQLMPGEIAEKKSLIVRASVRDIKAADIEERVLLSDIETMLKELKEKHTGK